MLKVVYDVDDTLWGLNRRVAQLLGIDYAKNDEFHIMENAFFTLAEREAILQAYCDAENFKQMDFYPGASDILAVEPYGATVRIHSNCFNEAIAAEKRAQLAQLLPSMKPAFIKLSTITSSSNRKVIDQDAYIFVDDNPYNIATSTAKFNFVPIKPWNSTSKAQTTMIAGGQKMLACADLLANIQLFIDSHQRYIIHSKDLTEINQAIITIVKAKQGVKHGKK